MSKRQKIDLADINISNIRVGDNFYVEKCPSYKLIDEKYLNAVIAGEFPPPFLNERIDYIVCAKFENYNKDSTQDLPDGFDYIVEHDALFIVKQL